jgi:hypothetical protein
MRVAEKLDWKGLKILSLITNTAIRTELNRDYFLTQI